MFRLRLFNGKNFRKSYVMDALEALEVKSA